MGISVSKQWNEMNEVNDAMQETETQIKSGQSSSEKKSLKNRLKNRILKSGNFDFYLVMVF